MSILYASQAASASPLAAAAGAIPTPKIEYGQLAPIVIVLATAVLGIVVEAFVPRSSRRAAQRAVALTGLVASFGSVIALAAAGYASGRAEVAAMGAVAVDGPALFVQGVILLISMAAVLFFSEERLEPSAADGPRLSAFAPQAAAVPGSAAEAKAARAGWTTTEIWPLTMFAVTGMLLFPAAADLLTMFVALEVLSLPLYVMCALARGRRLLSQEAALKYFLLGAFSSAFFLFGVALVYGYAGTVSLGGIAAAIAGRSSGAPVPGGLAQHGVLLLAGAAMLGVGLLFKIGAVPFHSWTPDVYQGAPTPVTGFMAAATKVAAFGALLRLLYVAFPALSGSWHPVMWVVAILTMTVGTILTVTQRDVKRLLAYSAIANAGFILTGALATGGAGVSSILFYLTAYSFVTLAAFAVVTLVRDAGGEVTHLPAWAGLGQRSPLLAAVFALLLMSFAGIPLTSGFTAKIGVFQAVAMSGATPLVIVGVLSSAIAAFAYLRVIGVMFFIEPRPSGPFVAVPSALTATSIALGVLVTLVLGLAPQFLLDLLRHVTHFAG